MIGQITPLVKVASRSTWMRAAAAHTIGSTVSGALAGAAFGAVGLVVSAPGWRAVSGVVAGVLVLCALKEARLLTIWLPMFQRPTPKWFSREFGVVWGAFAWGLDLGQGWTTRIELVGYYGIAAWALLIGGPIGGAAVLGTYGLARALPVVMAGIVSDNGDAWKIYDRRGPAIRVVDAVAMLAVAGFLAVTAL